MRRTPSDLFADGISGIILGGALGAVAGWSVGFWILDEPLWFWGDTIVIGAVVCATLAFFFGEQFLDWLQAFFQ